MRSDWASLPEAVMTEIADRVGGTDATSAPGGDHAEIAATVAGRAGKVFVKAASSELAVRSLRYELRVNKAVDLQYAPAVEWDFETDGWLVVGFEHCSGPHADLSPGSSDLELLAEALNESAETSAPGQSWFTPMARLGFDLPATRGDMLLHTDLNPYNLVVTPDGLRIVDWAMATKAALWVELSLLAQWLIGSGHTPEGAEAWLARNSVWNSVSSITVDDFAAQNASKWSLKAQQDSPGWIHDLADWTGQWLAYRSSS